MADNPVNRALYYKALAEAATRAKVAYVHAHQFDEAAKFRDIATAFWRKNDRWKLKANGGLHHHMAHATPVSEANADKMLLAYLQAHFPKKAP